MIKRINKQLADFVDCPSQYFHLGELISQQNQNKKSYYLDVTLIGPEETPYEGGIFFLRIDYPTDYPFRPPKVNFTTKIYHPNIYPTGYVCCCTIEMLRDGWSPAFTVIHILNKIVAILKDPTSNLSQCGSHETLTQFKNNKAQYIKTAKEWTLKYAT